MRRNGAGEMGQDAWAYMPERFTVVYAELVRKGLAGVGNSTGGYGRRRGGESAGPLRDEKALAAKKRMDWVLRKLAREYETGQKTPRRKCGGCAKFIESEWRYCAHCGACVELDAPQAPWRGLPLR